MHRCKTEWADYLWNPVTGCLNECEYCNTRKMALQQCGDHRLHMTTGKRWKDTDIFLLETPFWTHNGRSLPFPYGYHPTFHQYRMNNLSLRKRGAKIFVCAMGELFGDWIPDELIELVFAECEKYPQHTYFFLTKNPVRYLRLARAGKLPMRANMWYGTTVPTEETEYFYAEGYKVWINIEPLHGSFSIPRDLPVDWVVIGAETKARKEPVIPERDWVYDIMQICESKEIPCFMRNNLAELMGDDFTQIYPDILTVPPELTIRQRAFLVNTCGFCKREMPKKEMHTLSIRKGKRGASRTIGWLCDDCIEKLRQKME